MLSVNKVRKNIKTCVDIYLKPQKLLIQPLAFKNYYSNLALWCASPHATPNLSTKKKAKKM